MKDDGSRERLTFIGLLLLGVGLLMGVTAATCVGLYIVPPDVLGLSELQPFTRVARETEFPVGASRIVNWGEDIILVVRRNERVYAAIEGVSPADGCVLEWDADALRVVSPCTYVVHDLEGNVIEGLTTTPLRKYAVYVRNGIIYVTA
jgi:nitrite reductase/ring-hydroxylating ferredoxin subunit